MVGDSRDFSSLTPLNGRVGLIWPWQLPFPLWYTLYHITLNFSVPRQDCYYLPKIDYHCNLADALNANRSIVLLIQQLSVILVTFFSYNLKMCFSHFFICLLGIWKILIFILLRKIYFFFYKCQWKDSFINFCLKAEEIKP